MNFWGNAGEGSTPTGLLCHHLGHFGWTGESGAWVDAGPAPGGVCRGSGGGQTLGLQHLGTPLCTHELEPPPHPLPLHTANHQTRGWGAPLGRVTAWGMKGLRGYLAGPWLPHALTLCRVRPPQEEGHSSGQMLDHGLGTRHTRQSARPLSQPLPP